MFSGKKKGFFVILNKRTYSGGSHTSTGFEQNKLKTRGPKSRWTVPLKGHIKFPWNCPFLNLFLQQNSFYNEVIKIVFFYVGSGRIDGSQCLGKIDIGHENNVSDYSW